MRKDFDEYSLRYSFKRVKPEKIDETLSNCRRKFVSLKAGLKASLRNWDDDPASDYRTLFLKTPHMSISLMPYEIYIELDCDPKECSGVLSHGERVLRRELEGFYRFGDIFGFFIGKPSRYRGWPLKELTKSGLTEMVSYTKLRHGLDKPY